jgi:hypothetical protein
VSVEAEGMWATWPQGPRWRPMSGLISILGCVGLVTLLAACGNTATPAAAPARTTSHSSAMPTTTRTGSTPTTLPRSGSPSVASIDSAICAAAHADGVGDGLHCGVRNLKVSKVDPNWVFAAVGLYNAQNQPENNGTAVILNLSTHQVIGPAENSFCGEGTGIPMPGYGSLPPSVAASLGLEPCSSQVTTTSSPNISPTSTGIPFTLASLAGTWEAHEERLVIATSGTGRLTYADLRLCPSCSSADAPESTLVFVLTSVTNNEAMESVTASSDPKPWSIGEAVQVTLTAGSPGQLLDLHIGGDDLTYFCNGNLRRAMWRMTRTTEVQMNECPCP